MKLEPIITEKATNLAKEGKYSFRVDKGLTKDQIRELVSKTFGVKVLSVHTIKERGEVRKTSSGRKRIVKPTKKAIVQLGDKEKIDLFESKKK